MRQRRSVAVTCQRLIIPRGRERAPDRCHLTGLTSSLSILQGPLLSHLVCDKFQHVPVSLGDEAVITSVGYPVTPYGPLTKCMTSFYPATGDTRVQIDCADVQTDGSRMDPLSRLLVGGSDYLLLVAGFSWSEVRSTAGGPVRRVGQPGQVVRVGFFTDAVGRARGFSCSVRGVRAERQLECGVRQLPLIDRRRQARILGGTTQAQNQWPWAVQLFFTINNRQSVCSGTLIKPSYVLTSAHCLPRDGSPIRVVTGALRLGSGVPLTATSYTPHPNYMHNDNKPTVNDIGVVRLPFPQTYSAAVRPVCLPSANAADPTHATSVGWGQRWFGGPASNNLQAITLPLENRAYCAAEANTAGLANANVLCSRPIKTGATPCPSDSGGTLVSENNATGVYTQVGLTFAGENCTLDSKAVFFTRVSSFIDFIQANTP